MDDPKGSELTDQLAAAGPEYPNCPDCEQEFKPGHMCRASMIEEIARMRAAFQISLTALGKIRNQLIMWPKGGEVARLREVSATARAALADVQELLERQEKVAKEDENG